MVNDMTVGKLTQLVVECEDAEHWPGTGRHSRPARA